MLKTRPNDRLALLKGKTWNKMPAEEYLFMRLEGDDGEPPWSLEEAAAAVRRKLKKGVSESTISRWLIKQKRAIRIKEDIEAMEQRNLEFLTERPEALDNIENIVDFQIYSLLERVHEDEGAEAVAKVINALAGLKKIKLDERKLDQREKEWEERTEKMKSEILRLHKALKKLGLKDRDLDKLNKDTTSAIDKIVASNSGR